MSLNAENKSRASRAAKYGTNVLLGTALFLVILGALNFMAERSNWRVDLTRNKSFTLSESSQGILRGLKDKVTVTVYATEKGVPAEVAEQRDQLRSLLLQYRNVSSGRVSFTFRDPAADPDALTKAEQAGIPAVQMQTLGDAEFSIKEGYFGMVLQYMGKSQTIPVVRPDSSLEYQLTNAINKLAQVNIPTVGVVAPQGNPFMGDQGNFRVVRQLLQEEGYTVRNIEPSRIRDEDLKDTNLLLVLQPEELGEEALFRIDQFVMGGGKLLVAASGVQLDQRTGQATPQSPNINSLLEHYGVRVQQDMLEDWGNGRPRNYMTQRGFVRRVDPFAIEATDLNDTSTITAKIPNMILLYPSSIDRSALGTSATVTSLVRTSAQTRRQDGMFNMQSERINPPTQAELADLKAYDVAVHIKGVLNSRFAAVDAPVVTNDDGSTRTVPASTVKHESPDTAEVIVVSSPLSFFDEVLGAGGATLVNAIFLLNCADATTRGGDIIALRSKQTEFAALRKVEAAEARTTKALLIAGMPVLLALLGFAKLAFSRARRARYREIYGQGR